MINPLANSTVAATPRRNHFHALFEQKPLEVGNPPANNRRNHFHALFEQKPLEESDGAKSQMDVAQTRLPFSPPGAEVRNARAHETTEPHTRSGAAGGAHGPQPPTATTAASANGDHDLPELGWFTPSTAPVSLEPLFRAMERAGLAPGRFQFEQVEAYLPFPTRPDLDYTTRQIVIRGPNGVALFDRDLALRTPWVTAVELQAYGIA